MVTYPKVRYNPKILDTYTDYCYYQLIKYSNWSINDLEIIKQKSTAIKRFEEFYLNAPDEIRNSIK